MLSSYRLTYIDLDIALNVGNINLKIKGICNIEVYEDNDIEISFFIIPGTEIILNGKKLTSEIDYKKVGDFLAIVMYYRINPNLHEIVGDLEEIGHNCDTEYNIRDISSLFDNTKVK